MLMYVRIIRISCRRRRSGRSRVSVVPSYNAVLYHFLYYGFDCARNIIKTTNGLEECARRRCHRRTSVCSLCAVHYHIRHLLCISRGGHGSHRILAEKFKVRFNTMPSRLPTAIKKFRTSVIQTLCVYIYIYTRIFTKILSDGMFSYIMRIITACICILLFNGKFRIS